jgi:riboflavin kinase/FMN adenylyltransferase
MSVVTIGNFDGVHRGHQHLISQVIEIADKKSLTPWVVTLEPHPKSVFHPEEPLELLTSYEARRKLLKDLHPRLQVQEIPFSREVSSLGANEFLDSYFGEKGLQARELILGYDFRFGKNREGGRSEALDWGHRVGCRVSFSEPYPMEGQVVGSTRIRELLKAREVAQAARLLSRPFFYESHVVRGDQRGRELGFPTANFRIPKEAGLLMLPHGVYATRTTSLREGWTLPSVTNVGVRPTFADLTPGVLVETHLLDETRELYGELLRVDFMESIREERRFSDVSQLCAQIQRDIEAVKSLLD